MYLRMVEASVKKEAEQRLAEIYSDKIISSLESTPGCIFAGLLHSQDQLDRYISLTIWSSEKVANSYVQSGKFEQNLESIQHMLEKGSEWKIQLSSENKVEYVPVPAEPEVKSYPAVIDEETIPRKVPVGRRYLRILSLKINKGKKEEFSRVYEKEILPQLKKISGCRYAFLLDNSEYNGEMISLTIWDDLKSIETYEEQGKFKSFLYKVNHTLGGLYHWKMAAEKQSKFSKTVTSQDIGISKFTMVTSKDFR